MQLAVAHVDRDDARRPRLEQAVREPTGRRSDVRAVPIRDVDPKRVERVLQLLAPARYEARRSLDLELDVLGNLLAGLVVADDEPRQHERLRLRAGLCEPALDQHDVEALLRHAATSSWAS